MDFRGPKDAQKVLKLCFSHIAVNGKNTLQSTENISKYAQNNLLESSLRIDLTRYLKYKQQNERLHMSCRAKYTILGVHVPGKYQVVDYQTAC